MSIHHLVVGPAEHGVTTLALQLVRAAFDRPTVTRINRVMTSADLSAVPTGRTAVHVHVTDRLFGSCPEQAQEVLVDLAARCRLSVTLHDLPQPSDGPHSMPRRAACYAAVARASRRVIVSSEHERSLLSACLGQAETAAALARPVVVIPLPVARPAHLPPPIAAASPDLGVLGFVYPGKGHHEVLATLAHLPPEVGMLVLGQASAGHQDVVEDLITSALLARRRLVVTGYLSNEQLHRRLRSVAVPVAAHRHLSASGSINSWLSAGRRPLAPRSDYTLELANRLPGALTLYDDLAPAVARALDCPSSTWLDRAQVDQPGWGPDIAKVADRYRQVLAGLS